jgi:hypothetical protein
MSAGAPGTYLARQVEAMAGYGIPAEDIATALGIERWVLGLSALDDGARGGAGDSGHAGRRQGSPGGCQVHRNGHERDGATATYDPR